MLFVCSAIVVYSMHYVFSYISGSLKIAGNVLFTYEVKFIYQFVNRKKFSKVWKKQTITLR